MMLVFALILTALFFLFLGGHSEGASVSFRRSKLQKNLLARMTSIAGCRHLAMESLIALNRRLGRGPNLEEWVGFILSHREAWHGRPDKKVVGGHFIDEQVLGRAGCRLIKCPEHGDHRENARAAELERAMRELDIYLGDERALLNEFEGLSDKK